MAELVSDCPRCGANKITFDLTQAIVVRFEYNWKHWYETFCVCRKCSRSTIFVVSESVNANYEYVHKTGLINIKGAVNSYIDIEGIITLKDSVKEEPPEFIPESVEAIFREGATCLSLNCFNAAGTMFRLCIDLVTRFFLPEEGEGLNHRTRRDLGLRLPWLFDNGILPEALRDLSTCVREDGNDGAHQGTLTKDDAIDLLDFTTILLERIYTEPERLRLAQERRRQRREENV
ncbi:DUF4145 domain-containing protein [Aeromonas hydrophila]|uniref:DUF4145 domain-containing protein n=1 Tax=Aeromonas TaxID=642 RepID=UPI00148B3043|nr:MULTISPECIES: DUF4145 domain-containing protein [Aeromonas]EGX6955773.1 DUF4145 domain-containing protein [Aeromonas hydrophila]MBL0434814.1 DUF4145 domain-containing protein [Aeromonas hydrophila]MBL0471579.1 DUF4145 domain-containing protein [Aeromonas hydrophila]QJT16427.1 DUF4145 domain-containing protein [Aeromonas sp. 1805]